MKEGKKGEEDEEKDEENENEGREDEEWGAEAAHEQNITRVIRC